MAKLSVAFEKVPSGVRGLDEITEGGLPKGRPILVAGRAGCGKTVLAMEFLARGALEQGEPGVFMAFEENEGDLRKNFASLGFDLEDLIARKLLLVDHIRIERGEIEETGEYDLEGLLLSDIYVGEGGVLTGAARAAQEGRDRVQAQARSFEMERKRRELERKRRALDAQIALLRTEFEIQEEDLLASLADTDPQDHRGPVQHRTRAGRSGPAARHQPEMRRP